MPLEVIVRPPPAVHILLRNSASILQRAELIGGLADQFGTPA